MPNEIFEIKYTRNRAELLGLCSHSFPAIATDSSAICLEPDYTIKTKVRNFNKDIRKVLKPNVSVRIKNCSFTEAGNVFDSFFFDKINERRGKRTSLRWLSGAYWHKDDFVINLWFVNYQFCTQDTILLSREQETIHFTLEETDQFFFEELTDIAIALVAHFRGLYLRNRVNGVLYPNEYKQFKELRMDRDVYSNSKIYCYFHYSYESDYNENIDNWIRDYNEFFGVDYRLSNSNWKDAVAVEKASELIRQQAIANGFAVA